MTTMTFASESLSKKAQATRTYEIAQIIGSLSSPSKMPCHSWSISAKKCITGAKLREVNGSTCEKCYALKGFYSYRNVREALEKRLEGFNHFDWVNLMTEQIKLSEKSGYFRWFDSGDVQSLQMLESICQIANNLPEIKFWLPTREYSIVSEYLEIHGKFPKNLTVRLSAYMMDTFVSDTILDKLNGVVSSNVTTNEALATCPTPKQGNQCHDCRKCWKKSVANVTYAKH